MCNVLQCELFIIHLPLEAVTLEQEFRTISIKVKVISDLEDRTGTYFTASIETQESDLSSSAEAVSILKSFGSPITYRYTEV